jgi:type III restriction enzyme
METGTGKTYVYTRLMFELHKKLGLFKFIIVVPSLAIKEGTKHFIESDYAMQHFNRYFSNKKINLQTINAGDFSGKKGRKIFPLGLLQFCDASKNETNSIQCLLLSDKGFLDRKDSALFKDDYDQTLFDGINNPSMALKKCCPIVIIDEPHRIKREGNTYKNIMEKLSPQIIIRFGATFTNDYYRGMPIFDLGAVEAFNKDLVKGIDISYPNLPENEAIKIYRVKNVNNSRVIFTKDNKEWEIKANESLSEIDNGAFQTDIEYIGGADKKLSNDLELYEGMKFFACTFSNSYQEILLSQAINAHFEKEQENFFTENNAPKIKTISLFFIDNIKSYREQNGWLKITFEKLLNKKLDELLKKYESCGNNAEKAYLSFLQESKKSLQSDNQEIHAGYFAEDKGKGDEAIQKEIDDILNNKEEMLSFKNKNDKWNIRRFLFSKWTLREGWDNPNVFVICKLRTSGSENSKIQEVGRGLRLPVNEIGGRLCDREYRLSYIIGYDEKDFAEKLVGEINKDAKVALNREKLTEEMMKIIIDTRNITEEELLEILDEKGIIKRNNSFREGGFEKLLTEYPELTQTQLKNSKVTSNNRKGSAKIKLRKQNWEKIRSFWEEVSKRYMLCLERLKQNEIESLIENTLQKNIFNEQSINIVTKTLEKGETLKLSDSKSPEWNVPNISQMKYGEFIKGIHKRTFIPIALLHKKIWAKLKSLISSTVINENSLNSFVAEFKKEFEKTFAAKYSYYPLDFSAETTVLKNGNFVEELEQGLVGINLADITEDKRNLYEGKLAYDSDIEKKILEINPNDMVTVFGKIPRKSIKIPLYTGGSTSPDFVYAIKKEKETQLHLVIESKSDDLRESEKIAIDAQEIVFQKFANVKWKKATKASDVENVLREMATL